MVNCLSALCEASGVKCKDYSLNHDEASHSDTEREWQLIDDRDLKLALGQAEKAGERYKVSQSRDPQSLDCGPLLSNSLVRIGLPKWQASM